MSPYKLGMGGNLTIGLPAVPSPGTAVIGAVLCFGTFLLNLLIHFFSPRLHQTPNVTLHTLLLPWTIGHPLGFGPLTPTGALFCLLSSGSS
jgi:hypothetical protein